jgi:hypothetical protein
MAASIFHLTDTAPASSLSLSLTQLLLASLTYVLCRAGTSGEEMTGSGRARQEASPWLKTRSRERLEPS